MPGRLLKIIGADILARGDGVKQRIGSSEYKNLD